MVTFLDAYNVDAGARAEPSTEPKKNSIVYLYTILMIIPFFLITLSTPKHLRHLRIRVSTRTLGNLKNLKVLRQLLTPFIKEYLLIVLLRLQPIKQPHLATLPLLMLRIRLPPISCRVPRLQYGLHLWLRSYSLGFLITLFMRANYIVLVRI